MEFFGSFFPIGNPLVHDDCSVCLERPNTFLVPGRRRDQSGSQSRGLLIAEARPSCRYTRVLGWRGSAIPISASGEHLTGR
jgi:hypothetical protein